MTAPRDLHLVVPKPRTCPACGSPVWTWRTTIACSRAACAWMQVVRKDGGIEMLPSQLPKEAR